jgi:hypothetical protein
MWPDVEATVRGYLATTIDGRTVTILPARLEDNLPVTRILRGPGSDDGITDGPLLDVETFAASRGDMWRLAEETRQALHALAGKAYDGVLVDTVDTATGPTYVDYGNPKVHRAVASYRLALRQKSSAA